MKNDKKNQVKGIVDPDMPKLIYPHGKVYTRRDALRAGIINMAAAYTLPSVVEWFARAGVAEAAEACNSAGGGGMPAYIEIHAAGGMAMSSQMIFGPKEDPDQYLPSYTTVGMGTGPALVMRTTTEFANKATFFDAAGVILGIRASGITATTLANTVAVGIPCQSNDDSSSNMLSASGIITKLGNIGEVFPPTGTQQTPSGGRHLPAFTPPPAPLVVQSYEDLANALQVAGALTELSQQQKTSMFRLTSRLTSEQSRVLAGMSGADQLSALAQCATGTNLQLVGSGVNGVDPRQNTAIATLWGINNAPDNNANVVRASIAFNAMNGKGGTGCWSNGGRDYHQNPRPGTDAADTDIGVQIGRTLQTAAILNKPVCVVLSSDGAVSSNQSEVPGQATFTSDSGNRGAVLMFFFDPAKPPVAKAKQVGGMTTGQVADTRFPTGGNPQLAAAAVAYNYASFAGKLSGIEAAIGQRPFSLGDLEKVILVSKG